MGWNAQQIRRIRPIGRIGPIVLLAACPFAAAAQDAPYAQSVGYRAQVGDLKGGGIAVSTAGLLAVARDDDGGKGAIEIYNRWDAPNRTLLWTIRAPNGSRFRYFGGISFQDDDTLYFAENGDQDTVYLARLSSREVRAIAPIGSLPDVGPIARREPDGAIIAGTSGGPGKNGLFAIADGQVTPILRDFGVGYLGGLALDPGGRLFVGDTADPEFAGKPGQILEIGAKGEVRRVISLAAGGGSGVAGLICDPEGDLLASTGATLTHVRPHGEARVTVFGRFGDKGSFPTSLSFRGTRFEPGSGDGMLLVNGGFTGVGALFAITTTAERATLPADFATRVVAFDGRNGVPAFAAQPEAVLGPPSATATPGIPDNAGVFSFGWGGSVTLAFDRPILNDPHHFGGYDFSVYGNSLFVGGSEFSTYQEPAYVEAGLDLNGNGRPDPGEPFYLLRGRPDPGAPARWPLPASLFGAVDHRQTPMLGYADVTPTNGLGDPLIPDDPLVPGITTGTAGGDAFDLSWAVDAEGRPVALTHADFVRITHALDVNHALFGASSSEIDAVSLVRPSVLR